MDASELRRWALRVLDTPRTIEAAEALIRDLLECVDPCEEAHAVDVGPGVPTGRLSDRDYLTIV
jgi:hypothetical protein